MELKEVSAIKLMFGHSRHPKASEKARAEIESSAAEGNGICAQSMSITSHEY
jgi:hypothetical protein